MKTNGGLELNSKQGPLSGMWCWKTTIGGFMTARRLEYPGLCHAGWSSHHASKAKRLCTSGPFPPLSLVLEATQSCLRAHHGRRTELLNKVRTSNKLAEWAICGSTHSVAACRPNLSCHTLHCSCSPASAQEV
jgi:hypothetical protein